MKMTRHFHSLCLMILKVLVYCELRKAGQRNVDRHLAKSQLVFMAESTMLVNC